MIRRLVLIFITAITSAVIMGCDRRVLRSVQREWRATR